MVRFTVHSPDTAPEGSRAILEQARSGLGFVPNLYGVMAESPVVLGAYTTLTGILQGSAFTAGERDLLWLAISRANGCGYCVAAHSALSAMDKVPGEQVQAIRNGTALADPRLQALRRFAEAVVEHRGWVPDGEVEAFLAAGFDHRNVLEVVAFVAHKTLSNYVNHLAETPLDPAFAPLAWTPEAARV